MNYIIIIICSIILPIVSLREIKPKLCINCKYFITDEMTDKYAKCSLFPKEENNINFFVNGKLNEEFHYCSISRSLNKMCGEEGRMYKRKYLKKMQIK
jgi:hypothetical protein